MHILKDKSGHARGYLYNNVILLPGHIVAGVMLAHCVFTKNGVVKGKFFNDMLYNEDGEIVARADKDQSEALTADMGRQIMLDAWQVLAVSKDHLCPWVIATDAWAPTTLEAFLLQ